MLDAVKPPPSFQKIPKFNELLDPLLNGERVLYHTGYLASDRVLAGMNDLNQLANQMYQYVYRNNREPRGVLLQKRVYKPERECVQYRYYAQLFRRYWSPTA